MSKLVSRDLFTGLPKPRNFQDFYDSMTILTRRLNSFTRKSWNPFVFFYTLDTYSSSPVCSSLFFIQISRDLRNPGAKYPSHSYTHSVY